MKNAIVYSLHVGEKSLLKNYTFHQLQQSIISIRDVNPSIDIKVFISPPAILNNDLYILNLHKVQIIPFVAMADPRLNHKEYALWTSHKWVSSFRALREFNYDNILYVDTDTIFQKDPEYLFEKYGNTSSIYGKQDVSDKYTKIFEAKNQGMNDGQFLLSKQTLKYEKDILKERVEYVLRLQEKFKDEKDNDTLINGVQWVSCQYAISEYLYKVGNPLKFFDEKDVHIVHRMNEFVELSKEEMDSFALIHYLNYNTRYFFPHIWKVYLEARNG